MSDAVDESHLPVLCRSASLSACSVFGSLTVSGSDEALLRHLWSPYLYWPESFASLRIGPWRAPTFGPVGEEASALSLEVSYKFFCVLGLAAACDVLVWEMSEWLIHHVLSELQYGPPIRWCWELTFSILALEFAGIDNIFEQRWRSIFVTPFATAPVGWQSTLVTPFATAPVADTLLARCLPQRFVKGTRRGVYRPLHLVNEWRAGRPVLLFSGTSGAGAEIPGRRMIRFRKRDIFPCLVEITAAGQELLSRFVDAVVTRR